MNFLAKLGSAFTGGIFSGVSEIIGKVKADPTRMVELEAELIRIQADLEGKVIVAESEAKAAVNKAIEAEAKSEHWAQWLWRPTVGFTFAGTIINNYILYPYFAEFGMVQVDIPSEVWMAILAVLGVASWHRGVKKVEEIKLKG